MYGSICAALETDKRFVSVFRQADLEDEQARTAAFAQDARSAQEAYVSLQARMQDVQQKSLTVQVCLAFHVS